MSRIRRIECFRPSFQSCDDFVCFSAAEFQACSVAGTVLLGHKRSQNLWNRFAFEFRGPERLFTFRSDPIDTTVLVVSVWIAHVVLHVADDGVLPVSNVQGPVAADFDVAWAEVRVT